MKYSGTKSYNTSFAHEGTKDVKDVTTYTVENLVPGTKYKFEVYRISVCGNKGSSASFDEETKMEGKQRMVNQRQLVIVHFAPGPKYMSYQL